MNTATTAGGGTMKRAADADDAKADVRASTTTTAGRLKPRKEMESEDRYEGPRKRRGGGGGER